MHRREFLALGAAALATNARPMMRRTVAASPATEPDAAPAARLYNGIALPSPWPPKLTETLDTTQPPSYLRSPPAVIPIDLGRQLFVDDFLIEKTNLARTFHRPTPYADNPIVRPDKPWEQLGGRMAMVFSDGVWYDAADKQFKMWYMGGYGRSVCFAHSDNGVHWVKPKLDVQAGTNIVQSATRDSTTVWLDRAATDPARRYVLFRSHSENKQFGQSVYFSSDGNHWGGRVARTGSTGDRTTAFYNPFRRVWVYSLRDGWGRVRGRRYWETPDLVRGPAWEKIDQPTMWLGADALDAPRDDLRVAPQLYNLDCVAYESLMLGLFTIWRGDKNLPPGRPKPNNVCVGFSRDGFHWSRPDRSAFLDVSEHQEDWNWGNVQSAGGCCLVVGDELYFYYSGRAGSPGDGKHRDSAGSTGLARLRRDGFASMDGGEAGGSLTTRPLSFFGKHLFVNADVASGGTLTAEALDDRGEPIERLSASACVPLREDKTKQAVMWKGAELSATAGRTVRFRFHLKRARLFAFWVSRTAEGKSDGYVAAGGPGLTDRDG